MNHIVAFFSLALFVGMTTSPVLAQNYVFPKLGGGQVAAEMIHIDIYYDKESNRLLANLDDSYGLPQLRPLDPGAAFEPTSSYAVLNGKAYNAQYGWNAGGFFEIPPGAAIWIELIDGSPDLETYEGWGRLGTHTPIFGTAGSSRKWKWSGVMVHNTYAVRNPLTDLYFAEYHIYFGDADTGSQAGFEQYADATVRLEWAASPVNAPFAFKLGASGPAEGAALLLLNASDVTADSGLALNLGAAETRRYERRVTILSVPATAGNGGPAPQHAGLGACVQFELVSLRGPRGSSIALTTTNGAASVARISAGEQEKAVRIRVTAHEGSQGADPYGRLDGCSIVADTPGLYYLEFRLVDTSTNGTGGLPVHAPSHPYRVCFQAGLAIGALQIRSGHAVARFGGAQGRMFYLERTGAFGDDIRWETVAGPTAGADRLLELEDPETIGLNAFYRLRVVP